MKYIIEIKPEYEDTTKGIMVLGARDSKLFVDTVDVANLEVLNSDYINEHFGDLQDTAYQKGLEDGKAVNDKGCEGCRYGGTPQGDSPCFNCSNYYQNNWTAKQTDDEIKVGDEVEWDNDFTGDRFIVTRIYQPYGKKEQCDGIDDDGDVYRAVLIESLVKTGRHFDILSILEDMRND